MSTKHYVFRRPRALQYVRIGDESNTIIKPTNHTGHDGHVLLPLSEGESHNAAGEPAEESQATLKRSHLDLFVDLIFVGIVGNLSEHFSDVIFSPSTGDYGASGHAVFDALVEFYVLFLLTWRIWNYLRDFVNSFFLDDILQRTFIVWILILAVLIGNAGPWVFEDSIGANTVVIEYLIIRVSFIAIEGFYCFFIPWLWKETLAQFVLSIPSFVLWITMTQVSSGKVRLGLIICAMVLDAAAVRVLHLEVLDRLLHRGYKKAIDLEHYVERIGAFFVIILGEGVLLLIKSSPLGESIKDVNTGAGIAALGLYFCLHMLIFRNGASVTSLDTMQRTRWKIIVWQLFHIVLFSALLILAVVSLFVVKNVAATAAEPTDPGDIHRRVEGDGEGFTPEGLANNIRLALWIGAGSLSIVIFALSGLAIMNRSAHELKNALVPILLLRMIPRGLVIVIICCLPLVHHLIAATWLEVSVPAVYLVVVWEVLASSPKGTGFFEPKDQYRNR